MTENSIALNPDIRAHITQDTPPTFLLQNEDDHVDCVEDSLSYYAALKRAGVPVEMHLYAREVTPSVSVQQTSGNPLARACRNLAWYPRRRVVTVTPSYGHVAGPPRQER